MHAKHSGKTMNLVDSILFHGRFQLTAPAILLAGDGPPMHSSSGSVTA